MNEEKRPSEDLKPTESRYSYARPGTRIGNYRILQKIGEGGMGDVFEAEQEQPVRRRVALKLIRGGMDSKYVVARFESERQALALMDHPNIARVFDGGATEDGRPYFVMEWVKGVPLTEYCDTLRLSTTERLELFIQICHGVQHAHQKGIIHRDIKPSNVLVTVQEEKPVPKIIDFGVAKATAQPLTERTLFTELGQLVGTPEYMSPEQADMSGLDIDTRTDVYSLGVLLYELLVGSLPFDTQELRRAGFDGIRRIIREQEPLRPSTRVSSAGQTLSGAAHNRRTDLNALARQLKGDLDWITMKALEKDRTRRYASASELTADVVRYLKHEPVLAGPPRTMYLVRKYVRRHKTGVAAAALVTMALLVGITGTSIGLLRALEAERLAKDEAETARRVSEFLVGLFQVSDPSEARGNTITAREILDRGAEKIERELADQPLVRARLMDTMGQVYRKLGLYDQAKALLEKALSRRREMLGEENLQVSESLNNLANVLWERGEYERASPLFQQSLKIREKAYGPDHPEVADTLNNIANLLLFKGSYAQAKPLLERSLYIREKALGPDHSDVASALNSLGALHYMTAEYAEAKPLLERALAIREKVLAQDHPQIAMTLNNLALVLKEMGEYGRAKRLLERTIAIQERVLGPDHPNVASALSNLGYVDHATGDRATAMQLYERAIRIQEKSHGPDHPELARFIQNLSDVLLETGDVEGARRLTERALAIREKTLGPEHPDTARSLHGLGRVCLEERQYVKAEGLFRRSLEIVESALGPEHPQVAWSLMGIADVYSRQGRHEEAELLYRRALAIHEKASGPEHPILIGPLTGYAAVLRHLNQEREARDLEARAEVIRRRAQM